MVLSQMAPTGHDIQTIAVTSVDKFVDVDWLYIPSKVMVSDENE